MKRACRGAARRLEQRGERTTETARLSDAVESLRRDVAGLLDRVQKAEVRSGSATAAKSTGAASPRPSKQASKKAGKKGKAPPPRRRGL